MDPLLGTIILSPYSFAPRGWMYCAGQVLNIQTNTALFALLGTQFGGNGTTTFALPDLRGRIPVGVNDTVAADRIVTAPVDGNGNPTRAGQVGDTLGANVRLKSTGVASVALTVPNLPAHTHTAVVTAGSSTVQVKITASLDDGVDTTPMAGGYLAKSIPSGGSDASIYRPALGTAGSVDLAVANGTVTGSPTVTNSLTGSGTPLAVPLATTAATAPTPPFLALQYIIAIEGIFPSRN